MHISDAQSGYDLRLCPRLDRRPRPHQSASPTEGRWVRKGVRHRPTIAADGHLGEARTMTIRSVAGRGSARHIRHSGRPGRCQPPPPCRPSRCGSGRARDRRQSGSCRCSAPRRFPYPNGHPHQRLDPKTDQCAQTLIERFHIDSRELPIVLCPNGQLLRNPSDVELARCVGLVQPMGWRSPCASINATASGIFA
jgi:hypothetical protein